jgi:hypothetical protein
VQAMSLHLTMKVYEVYDAEWSVATGVSYNGAMRRWSLGE